MEIPPPAATPPWESPNWVKPPSHHSETQHSSYCPQTNAPTDSTASTVSAPNGDNSSTATIGPTADHQPEENGDALRLASLSSALNDDSSAMSDNQQPTRQSDASAGDDAQPHRLAQEAGHNFTVVSLQDLFTSLPPTADNQPRQPAPFGGAPHMQGTHPLAAQIAHALVHGPESSQDVGVPPGLMDQVVVAIAGILGRELPGLAPLSSDMPADLRSVSFFSGAPLGDTIHDGGDELFGRAETAFLRALVPHAVLLGLRDRNRAHPPMPLHATVQRPGDGV